MVKPQCFCQLVTFRQMKKPIGIRQLTRHSGDTMIKFTELEGRQAQQSRCQEIADELEKSYYSRELRRWFLPGGMGKEFYGESGRDFETGDSEQSLSANKNRKAAAATTTFQYKNT